MEARKITIVATNVQKKYVLESAAETLGQLKEELSSANISYEGMTFMEGLTRTEMKDDNSVLPTNVKRVNRATGEETVTNELVFMLTNSDKKIKSGSRSNLYCFIKDNGLQDEVKATFGKNFTQVKTSDLELFVSGHSPEQKNACSPEDCIEICSESCVDKNARGAIKVLCAILQENGCLLGSEEDDVLSVLAREGNSVKEDSVESPYTDEEIKEMFADL